MKANDRLRFRTPIYGADGKFKKFVFFNAIDGSPAITCSDGDVFKETEQCTGLKDKNGRLIYEWDIVCWTRAQTDGDVDSICPIFFDNDMCSFGPLLNGHSLWMPYQTDLRMKVVGNIHENPELLEDKKCK